MSNPWTKSYGFGSVSTTLGSLLWSQKKMESDQLASSCASDDTNPSSPYELKLVQVLFRHGARTPLKSIPDVMEVQWVPTLLEPPAHTLINYILTDLQGGPKPPSLLEDQYRKIKLTDKAAELCVEISIEIVSHLPGTVSMAMTQPCAEFTAFAEQGGSFPGQLTTLGMQQLYDLGKRLRRRYIEETPFLSSSFSSAEVYVRSTNVVRTIESARCLIAGLFQQKQKDVVPIVTTDAESEILYPNYNGCKMLKMLSSHRWAEFSTLPDIAADMDSLKRALGVAANQNPDFVLIRDDMVARETHGLPCPPELQTWRNKVEQRAVEMACHVFEPTNREKLQLSVGPVLHTMLTNIEERLQGSSGEPHRKLYLYSAHDTTLLPCLMALGIFDMKWPPFAADITVELHQQRQTNNTFVKVSYTGQDQLIPGCSGVYCPLEEFKQAVSAYSMSTERYKSRCNQTNGVTEP